MMSAKMCCTRCTSMAHDLAALFIDTAAFSTVPTIDLSLRTCVLRCSQQHVTPAHPCSYLGTVVERGSHTRAEWVQAFSNLPKPNTLSVCCNDVPFDARTHSCATANAGMVVRVSAFRDAPWMPAHLEHSNAARSEPAGGRGHGDAAHCAAATQRTQSAHAWRTLPAARHRSFVERVISVSTRWSRASSQRGCPGCN